MPRQDQVDIFALSDLCTPWCIHVVATLGVADYIAAGITRIEDIAAASGASSESLRRVMKHLVGKGLFEEPSPGQFALNDGARGLLTRPRGSASISTASAVAWRTRGAACCAP